jgi:hypothetical protein
VVIGVPLLGVCGDVETFERFRSSSMPSWVAWPNTSVPAASGWLDREGVEVVADIGPEVEPMVGILGPSTVDVVNDVSLPVATSPG